MCSALALSRVHRPLVVIIGATGTGKSKLAIQIASKFNGEIISADSMQVYRGLNIITNKVTTEERKLVPHHMIDFLDPLKKYTVVDYRNATLPIIDKVHSEGKLPVVVGGTHYYVESILWNVLIGGKTDADQLVYESDLQRCQSLRGHPFAGALTQVSGDIREQSSGEVCIALPKHTDGYSGKSDYNGVKNSKQKDTSVGHTSSFLSNEAEKSGGSSQESPTIEPEDSSHVGDANTSGIHGIWEGTDTPTEELYNLLEKVDPRTASQLHPNMRRKIVRALQVFEQTGRPLSELLEEQKSSPGGSSLGGGLRFIKAICLWVSCDKEVLDKRLDERVDDMIERGLLKELLDFHVSYNEKRLKNVSTDQAEDSSRDKDTAVTSSTTASSSSSPASKHMDDIYWYGIFQSIGFKEFHEYLILPEEERATEHGEELYKKGVELLKVATRQYSRRQLKWIKNRMLPPSARELPPVYALEGTDLNSWEEQVLKPAEEIVQSFLEERVPSFTPAERDTSSDPPGIDRRDKTRFYCEVCERVMIGQFHWHQHTYGAKHRKALNRKRLLQRKAEREGKPPLKKSCINVETLDKLYSEKDSSSQEITKERVSQESIITQ